MEKAGIKQGMKLMRQVQDQLNKTKFEPKTISNNFTLAVSDWTLENDKYKANISAVGVTAENYAEVEPFSKKRTEKSNPKTCINTLFQNCSERSKSSGASQFMELWGRTEL